MVVDAATAACFVDFAASLYWLPNVSFATLFAGCIIFQRHQLCQANTSSDFVARLVSCLTLFASVCSWQILGHDHNFHVSLGKMPTTPSVPSCQADVPRRLADAVRHPSVPATRNCPALIWSRRFDADGFCLGVCLELELLYLCPPRSGALTPEWKAQPRYLPGIPLCVHPRLKVSPGALPRYIETRRRISTSPTRPISWTGKPLRAYHMAPLRRPEWPVISGSMCSIQALMIFILGTNFPSLSGNNGACSSMP